MGFCPVAYALSCLDGKWKLRVVYVISITGTIRFNELQRQVDGISNLMLSKSLHELESDGIVYRKQYNEVPPRVEYSLTEVGSGIRSVMDCLNDFGQTLHDVNSTVIAMEKSE